ncbi:MAG: hypothetical protein ACFFHV_22455 [Promethearchaeota archaeon]
MSSGNKYFKEQLTFNNFSEAFNLLEDYNLIRHSGEEFTGNALCVIIDILRLNDFIKLISY